MEDNMRSSSRAVSRNMFDTVTTSRLFIDLKRYKFIYFLIIPGIIYFLIFNYYPLYFLQVAFKKYSIFGTIDSSPWIGFQNFIRLFKTHYFMQAFENTVILSVMYKVFGFPVPIILALLLNEIRHSIYKRSVQTLVYIPHFLSWVIVGSIWITLLSPEGGIINEVLKLLGVEPIFFMADQKLFRWVIVFTHIWKECGWGTIIYLAAISGVDSDIYEASVIDGANRFQQAIKITFPCILPTILVVFILSLAKVLNIFEQVFVMYNPIVAPVSETLDTYVYQLGIKKGDISLATTVGLFKNIISLGLILLTNKISQKLQGYSII